MAAVRKILVPLDGEEGAKTTLAWANRLVRPGASKLVLVHVINTDRLPPERRGPALVAARERLLSMSREAGVTAPVHPLVIEGADPERSIANTAWIEKCDLIVIGTRGGAAVKRWLVGGVTERVIRRSLVPVMAVPRGTLPPAEGAVRRILVPLDGSSLSDGILPVAELVGGLFEEAALNFLHVVPGARGKEADLRERLAHNLRSRMEEHCRTLALQDLEATFEVRTGTPPEEILRTARDVADMVVMSTHGYGGLKRWIIGSTAEAVLHGVHLPIVMYKAPSAARAVRAESVSPAAERS